jgi:predicted NAD/FAD-binding protein
MGQGGALMLTRRQTLQAVASTAGTALGLSGCRSDHDPQAPVIGGYTHESFERGHWLRDSANLPTPSQTFRTGCIIAGGGVAGLAASRALRLAGRDDFLVLELADEAGGNARGAVMNGVTHPLGAHYLPTPNDDAPAVQALLEELGVRRRVSGRWQYDERVLCHSPQERLFFKGEWQEGLLPTTGVSATTLAQYAQFHALIERWRRKGTFSIPNRPNTHSAVQTLHTLSFANYLQREGFSDPYLLWYLDYCCRDDYGAGLDTVSSWAGVHYFAARHGFAAPLTTGTGATDIEKSSVLTWPQGNGFLTQAMAKPLGERLHSGRVVTRIENTRSGVVVDAYNVHAQKLERYEAPHGVLALPAFVAARVLVNPPAAVVARAKSTVYSAWAVSNLFLNAPLDPGVGAASEMAWDNVIYAPLSKPNTSLGYVNATHQSTALWPSPTVLTHYAALGTSLEARKTLLTTPWGASKEQLLQALSAVHGDLARKVQQINITRYGHAMAVPVPRSQAHQQPAMPRIAFAHSDWAGYSVFEEAFEQGVQAVANQR